MFNKANDKQTVLWTVMFLALFFYVPDTVVLRYKVPLDLSHCALNTAAFKVCFPSTGATLTCVSCLTLFLISSCLSFAGSGYCVSLNPQRRVSHITSICRNMTPF